MQPLGPGDPLRLGPYRIVGVLGAGGMGKVYLGRDTAGRPAAVKVLLPELTGDRHLAERFVREARTAQTVTSEGVARVLAAEPESGRPWIASEFLAGPTLDEAVARYGPFGDALLRELARSLARTLADIHVTGLVHRDLKPQNVVLTSRGPRVIDFGIARPEHGLTLTRTGQIPVTPGYGAPEQVLGQRVGPAADVFSLGALLAYAASGRPAYPGTEVAAVMYEVVHGTPDLTLVPGPLRDLIAPCLAKDPAARPLPAAIADAARPPAGSERFWTTGPLADDIRRREADARQSTGEGTTTAVPAPRRAPDGPRLSRRGLLTAVAGGGALLAAGAGGTAWWLSGDDGTAGSSDPFDIPPAARVESASLGSDTGEIEPLWGPLEDAADPESPPPLPVRDVVVCAAPGGGIAAYDVTDGRERWRADDPRGDAGYLSAGDRLVVAADRDGALRTYVAATGDPKWTADAGAEVLLAADAGHVYLLTTDGRLRCVSTADARVRWTRRPPLPLTGRPVAAVGSGVLVVCGGSGDVAAVRVSDGAKAWVREGQAPAALRPAVDGGAVYLGGHTFAAVRASDGEQLWSRRPLHAVRRGVYGFGPPTVAGGVVFTLDSEALRHLLPDGGEEAVTFVSDAAPPWQPPVVQAGSVWVAEREDTGVSGLPRYRKDTSLQARTYPLRAGESRTLAGDRNRLFVLNGGTLVALPVY
ncbi:PQQ-binding-like beta-propeller repeat protein [Streptomyces sp. NPDC000134]|uniref:serine/threonine-protein kinase n=1 Tax=Streptomyces sp. NPDC000134 TaxID=3364536 RepID=UPI0036992B54